MTPEQEELLDRIIKKLGFRYPGSFVFVKYNKLCKPEFTEFIENLVPEIQETFGPIRLNLKSNCTALCILRAIIKKNGLVLKTTHYKYYCDNGLTTSCKYQIFYDDTIEYCGVCERN